MIMPVILTSRRVYVYNLSDAGVLAHVSDFIATPGTGPRHIAFHPSGRVLYVLGEISGQVLTCSIDDKTGSLKEVASTSSLPFDEESATAGHNREDGDRGMHAAGEYEREI